MPRQPTGNPRGRPPGTGRLGEQVRFTVRIPTEIYQRLEAFAEGRSYTRGTPQLAGCVREALEHYLACPHRRQTHSAPVPSGPSGAAHHADRSETLHNSQPKKRTEATQERAAQVREATRQTRNVPQAGSDDKRQTENGTTAYDTRKYVLGQLCIHAHDYRSTGQSLRRISDRACMACHAARMRAYRQRQSHA